LLLLSGQLPLTRPAWIVVQWSACVPRFSESPPAICAHPFFGRTPFPWPPPSMHPPNVIPSLSSFQCAPGYRVVLSNSFFLKPLSLILYTFQVGRFALPLSSPQPKIVAITAQSLQYFRCRKRDMLQVLHLPPFLPRDMCFFRRASRRISTLPALLRRGHTHLITYSMVP